MIDLKILPREFYDNDTVKVAKNLLGKNLVRTIGKKNIIRYYNRNRSLQK